MIAIEKAQNKLHDWLGWGYPDKLKDDNSQTVYCKYCDYTLAQDLTGAWFHLKEEHQQTTSRSLHSSKDNNKKK